MTTYNISASAGVGGVISPSGVVAVPAGASQTFTFTPSVGYYVSGILVGGMPVPPYTNSYTFPMVMGPSSIAVSFTQPGLIGTILAVLAALVAGMTTGQYETSDYYVAKWYTQEPQAVANTFGPVGAVLAGKPRRRHTVFVGQDTKTETIIIRLYQPATRKAEEAAEVAPGMTRLMAMVDKAEILLRTDPTFGCLFVGSEITDVDPLLPGVADANVYRVAQITMTITRRALWGA
jgi:hypothetical protein